MVRITNIGRRRRVPRKREGGYGIMLALICVAVMGIYLLAVGEVWTTQAQRVKEEELLRKGDAIRRAIESYVKADASGRYPTTFDELLRDPRVSYVRRDLRDAYPDPMTNGPWEVVRGPGGELYGVYSSAQGTPLKVDGFPDRYASFSLQTTYQDWKFTFYPHTGLRRQ